MHSVFLDANILVDVLDRSAKNRLISFRTMNAALQSRMPVYVSPSSFVICNYYAGKFYGNKENLPQKLKEFFMPMRFTTEDAAVMELVMRSEFKDLEDALQYFSALTVPVSMLITWNVGHYPKSGAVSIIHPFEFLVNAA